MEKIDLFTILPFYCFAIFPFYCFAILPFYCFAILPSYCFFCILLFSNFSLISANLSIFDKSLLECSSENCFCSCCLLKFLFSSQKMFLLSSQKCKVLSPHLQCHAKFICPLRQNTNDHTLLLALILLEHLHNSTV